MQTNHHLTCPFMAAFTQFSFLVSVMRAADLASEWPWSAVIWVEDSLLICPFSMISFSRGWVVRPVMLPVTSVVDHAVVWWLSDASSVLNLTFSTLIYWWCHWRWLMTKHIYWKYSVNNSYFWDEASFRDTAAGFEKLNLLNNRLKQPILM